MIFKPTQSQRSVLLALKFAVCPDVLSGVQPSKARRIAAISALFADTENIEVRIFNGHEATLLRDFWLSMRPNDKVFAAGVSDGLGLLRQRSWQLRVIPSLEINLAAVYDLVEVDTSRMWTAGYIPRDLHDEDALPAEHENTFDAESNYEVTVHSREETVHSREETVHSRD